MATIAPSRPTVRVLHLEDNETDQILVAEMLQADNLSCEFVVATSKDEFVDALKEGDYQLILSDYTMPSYDGLSALWLAQKLRPDIPFVFFSGTIGEEIAIDSLKNGAVDYVLKQRPHRLVPAIRRALTTAEEHARLRRAEEKIREQADLLDKASDAILVCDMENRITFWNRSAERIYGWTLAEAIGRNMVQLFSKEPTPQFEEATRSAIEQGEWTGEMEHLTKDGRTVTVQSRFTLIRDKHGESKSKLVLNTDITEHKQLEGQFLRAQRLESLGVLASGIAHDLNNSLSPIVTGLGVLREQGVAKDLEGILSTMETSARRGADMVKQVLAFARGSDTHKAPVRVEQLVKEIGKIITDTFPKNIDCRINIGEKPWPVSGWPTQLHQVLLNLCVNARDAMPTGGTITLTLRNVELDAVEAAQHPDAKPGRHLCLSVADTGTGIPADKIEKIFEPFFTTKGPEKGTGLGLSTTMTIVKNHGGFLTVQSQPGRGTEFTCYLPAEGGTAHAEAAADAAPPPCGNGECILVVDDEEGILAIVRTALENYGYNVLTANNGPEAVVRLAEKGNKIDAVITDLAMPFMDGFATICSLQKIVPGIPIIAASGSESEISGVADRGLNVDAHIQKPFTTETLLTAVHHVLVRKK